MDLSNSGDGLELPRTRKIKNCLRILLVWIFSNIGICVLVNAYILLGALVFRAVEGEKDVPQFHNLEFKNSTVIRLWKITEKYNTLDHETWKLEIGQVIKDFQEQIIQDVHLGYDGADYAQSLWTFEGSLLYSITVITTIGYGHIYPRTALGKVITIFYAIIGMPLFILYLSNIGNIMGNIFKWTYFHLCKCRTKTSGNRSEFNETVSYEVITVPISLCLLVMVSYICGGAVLFGEWERWGFLDGSYFCFITLSTIGFGDIVPGDSSFDTDDEQFRLPGGGVVNTKFVFCSMYILIGMAVIAMCFNLMQEKVVIGVTTLGKKLGIISQ